MLWKYKIGILTISNIYYSCAFAEIVNGSPVVRHDPKYRACVVVKLAGKDIVENRSQSISLFISKIIEILRYFSQEIALEPWIRRLHEGKYVYYATCVQTTAKTGRYLMKTAFVWRRFDLQCPPKLICPVAICGHFLFLLGFRWRYLAEKVNNGLAEML